MFIVFTRTFWKENAAWPNGLEPQLGRKTTIRTFSNERDARECTQQWNATHKPGRLNRKAEYMQK